MLALIFLVALILLVLIFGPFIAGLFALLTAVAGSLVAAGIIMLVLFIGAVYALGCAFWCIWWCFDPKAASEALREAENERRARRG